MIKNKPYYILKDDKIVRENDVLKWAKWFENTAMTRERIVGTANLRNGYFISTVFLGIDTSFGMSPKPVLFEILVTDKLFNNHDIAERYSTYEEAQKGFAKIIKEYKNKDPWRILVVNFMKGFVKWTNLLFKT